MNNFGNAIKEIRRQTKLTQTEFGDKLGITKTGVYYWESGRSIPGKEMLERISDVFSVDYNYLLGGEKAETGSFQKHIDALCELIKENEKLRELVFNAQCLSDKDLDTVIVHVKGIKQSNSVY